MAMTLTWKVTRILYIYTNLDFDDLTVASLAALAQPMRPWSVSVVLTQQNDDSVISVECDSTSFAKYRSYWPEFVWTAK